jgi:hypothetical protein
MPDANSIFISYRRSDSNDIVGRIYDRLKEYFGAEVIFRDVGSIPYGNDFREYLNQTVGQCQVLVAVIGPTWMKVLQERLTNVDTHDWVRSEIETVLSKAPPIPVIPLLVGGAAMPKEADLPESLKPLAHRNAAQARPDLDFHHDIDRLIGRLEEIVGVPGAAPPPPQPTILSHVQQVKQSSLQQRLKSLETDYAALSRQRDYTTNAADRQALERQMANLEAEMERVAQDLDQLGQ